MEIALILTVLKYFHTVGHVGDHLQILMDDECSSRLNECGIVAETFQVSLFCAVDIEVVGVGTGDDRHPWPEPMETAVELIGFDNYEWALVAQYVVGAIVL